MFKGNWRFLETHEGSAWRLVGWAAAVTWFFDRGASLRIFGNSGITFFGARRGGVTLRGGLASSAARFCFRAVDALVGGYGGWSGRRTVGLRTYGGVKIPVGGVVFLQAMSDTRMLARENARWCVSGRRHGEEVAVLTVARACFSERRTLLSGVRWPGGWGREPLAFVRTAASREPLEACGPLSRGVVLRWSIFWPLARNVLQGLSTVGWVRKGNVLRGMDESDCRSSSRIISSAMLYARVLNRQGMRFLECHSHGRRCFPLATTVARLEPPPRKALRIIAVSSSCFRTGWVAFVGVYEKSDVGRALTWAGGFSICLSGDRLTLE